MAEELAGLEAGSPEADAIRPSLALALDVDDDVAALQLAKELRPWFGVVKVGQELFIAAGPDVVVRLVSEGFDVFLDLKLVDIPNTVGRAARVAGSLGATYLTMYAHGGADMLRAGTEGMIEGAALAGLAQPTPLAVTILTSDAGAPDHILGKRLIIIGHCDERHTHLSHVRIGITLHHAHGQHTGAPAL